MLRNGWNMETLLRVYNRTKINIGIVTMSGMSMNVEPGQMLMLAIKDILMLENNYPKLALFSKHLFEAVDETNEVVSLSDMGGYDIVQEETYTPDEEIREKFKLSAKKLSEWLQGINDEMILERVYQIAQEEDLPKSKVDIIKEKTPNKEWGV